jgi:ribosomal-protein-alanine N-acetyltransferase
LTIAPCPLAAAQCLIEDRAAGTEILGARLPPDWPPPELEEILLLYVQELLHDPSALGWGVWIVVERAGNVGVGAAGFKGRPDRGGTVEIGYGVVSAYRGRGYATEAVQALVRWALTRPEVNRVIAECAPENAASIRVLEQAGFHQAATRVDRARWEIPFEPKTDRPVYCQRCARNRRRDNPRVLR